MQGGSTMVGSPRAVALESKLMVTVNIQSSELASDYRELLCQGLPELATYKTVSKVK